MFVVVDHWPPGSPGPTVPLPLPDDWTYQARKGGEIPHLVQVQADVDTKKYGKGSVLLVYDSTDVGKFLGIAVSQSLIDAGLDRNLLRNKASAKAYYQKCQDKPTTAGVALCIVETFIDWLQS